MFKIKLVPIGGRIKSASVGLNLFTRQGNTNFQELMKNVRKNPPKELLQAYFPSNNARLKQMMQGIGFYRPMLKTDQGMGGNFLPFYIDRTIQKTDLSVRRIVEEEGLVIPELYLDHNLAILRELQKNFRFLDFQSTYRLLEPLLAQSREAGKGRTPFFFIRPALLSSPIVFGEDIITKVTEAVEQLLWGSENIAEQITRQTRESFLYFLADVFVSTDGTIAIEKLHFPDVGFFITELCLEDSIASEVQNVVRSIRAWVFDKIRDRVNSQVTIVTRDEVINRKEDVLEIYEIQSISRELQAAGVEIEVRSISEIENIRTGATCLLMNLDYSNGAAALLQRFGAGELICYPDPRLQIASRTLTGLRETVIPHQLLERFLSLIDCDPSNSESAERIVLGVRKILLTYGIHTEFFHVVVNGIEAVPVHAAIHHSWKQLVKRIRLHQEDGKLEDLTVVIRELPLTRENSLVTSSTGPRLHSFRFTFTV